MKVYHYTPIDRWIDINPWEPGIKAGLKASLGVCMVNSEDERACDKAVFGLLDPTPESWIGNTEYPLAWQSLMRKTGKLLLAYELTDEIIDKSYVIDWAHREHTLGGHRDNLGQHAGLEIPSKNRLTAEKAYWESRTPLRSYIEDPGIIAGVALPEVITICDIPIDLIEVSRTQPRLHNLYTSAKEDLQEVIQYDPNLEFLAAYAA